MASKMGEWAFLVGVLLAIVVAFFTATNADGTATNMAGWITLVLVVLGLIVGFLNVTEKETTPFLVAAAALMLTANADLSIIPKVGDYLQRVVGNIAVFVAPAAIVVALKAIRSLAKD